MKDTQSKVHIENIINYLMLAPLPLKGGLNHCITIIYMEESNYITISVLSIDPNTVKYLSMDSFQTNISLIFSSLSPPLGPMFVKTKFQVV
jgi:hypothetical protein